MAYNDRKRERENPLEQIKRRRQHEATKRKMLKQRNEWVDYFDDYVDILLEADGGLAPSELMTKARVLADLRFKVVEEKFEELDAILGGEEE